MMYLVGICKKASIKNKLLKIVLLHKQQCGLQIVEKAGLLIQECSEAGVDLFSY
ncbi:MAG: hypothetical protein QM802_04060 [Agriterribacter sp.]